MLLLHLLHLLLVLAAGEENSGLCRQHKHTCCCCCCCLSAAFLLPLMQLPLLPCLLRAPALVAAPHVPTVCFFGKEECVQKHKLLFHLLSCSLFKQKALH